MNELEESVSPQRRELQRHVLPPEVLAWCQGDYPGAVNLHIVRRTRAVVLIRGERVAFYLPKDEHGECTLQAEGAKSTLSLERSHPDLWGLARHIAAEAMLALRNGHKEYVRVKKRKQQSTQLPKADVH